MNLNPRRRAALPTAGVQGFPTLQAHPAIRKGARRQAAQRQYQAGTLAGAAFGRGPRSAAGRACQARSRPAQAGIRRGSADGLLFATTVSALESPLRFPAASTAATV